MINYSFISSDSKEFQNFGDLYHSSFPEDERRNFDELIEKLEDEKCPFRVMGVNRQGRFVGFIGYWQWSDSVYIEHFAVSDALRGKGAGTQILNDFIDCIPLPIIIEVEPALDAIAKRRIGFYKRLKFHLWDDVEYIQPPYEATKNSLPMGIMTYGIDLEDKNFVERLILKIKTDVYGFKQ